MAFHSRDRDEQPPHYLSAGDKLRSLTCLDSETGLATTPWADQADQPVLPQQPADQLDGRAAADEARQLAGKVPEGPPGDKQCDGARPTLKGRAARFQLWLDALAQGQRPLLEQSGARGG